MDTTASHGDFDTDVIVVGAGPIGLITACALAHHGVAVRLFEKRSEPRKSSRANNVWARTQELLESVDLRAVLAAKAYEVDRQTILVDGRPLDQVQLDDVISPYPKVLYSGQDVIEKTLIEQAQARGVIVALGRQVTSLEQDDHGVTVSVQHVDEHGEPCGHEERVRSRYLVGADGNDGFVRKSLGLDFEPTKLPGRAIRSIDAKLTWQRSTDCDQLWFFTYHSGFAGVLPVWEGYHRLFFLEDADAMADRDPTLDEMQAHAREIIGDETLTLADPIWMSYGRFQHGVADRYAAGRVFLAGDAGHTTLPIGGQGMNAGMHDAIGIAWRLAQTLAGHASASILASFDGERQSQHATLDKQQTTGFDRLVYRNRIEDMALAAVGKLFPSIGGKLLANDDLQQLTVAYPDSPLTEDHLKKKDGCPSAGDRAPDAPLTACDGRTSRLFPIIYNASARSWGWNILGFDGRDNDAIKTLRAACLAVTGWDFVRSTFIVSAPEAMETEGKAKDSLSDLDGVAHAAYGLADSPALVLIRPDGHIAFRCPAERDDLLLAYCENTFGRPVAG